jgi:hypothetical protein
MSAMQFELQDIIRLAITTAAGITVFSAKELVAAPGDGSCSEGDQAMMFVPPSTYTVPPVMRRAKGLAR